jgi:hypothetical protein
MRQLFFVVAPSPLRRRADGQPTTRNQRPEADEQHADPEAHTIRLAGVFGSGNVVLRVIVPAARRAIRILTCQVRVLD